MARRPPVRVLVLGVLLTAAIAAGPAAARARDEGPDSGGGFAGVGSILCTLVYSPLKMAYAVSGVVVGGLAWAWSFGNRRVTRPIFRSSLGGDYVVSPAHLRGERRLRFTGSS
ncbi:MAG: hypothetical protein ACE5FL_02920 [Myxococcota bacterium]